MLLVTDEPVEFEKEAVGIATWFQDEMGRIDGICSC
jgi:hypothetical protein